MIVRIFTVGPFAMNAYLVGCPEEKVAALVDPGGDVDELLAAAERLDLSVDAIWLTHAHLDHVAGVAEAVRQTGAPVWLHPEDRFLYDAAEEQGAAFGIEVESPPPPDRELVPGESLTLGALSAAVRHLPGHSPGHVVFRFDSEAAVLVGDTIFAGSIGRTDLPGGDHATLIESIEREILCLDDDVRLYPGHGPPTTVGRERAENPFLA